ncbi:hypothetical protein A3J90_01350 [candidate division WOR-1 bacterium RIFOXYC2_FULL_37_10]|uniref:HEPN domain-containing protein n=1 Tax=candidate division WOR-1 bacterium RIFOXYB2_FULL_37_13 TaxID=1802579 RepID=A0A1F4SSZ8_UNCSA|nr:MAG: hypothetical protein A2310_03015 [candidate division WOR-1 bacterium RIFOXYB2_FULL_37_13]OGC35764.1 MAG: hypothetical protein A3J90_01350 [candidate division WOR-1 bacterium RIFOXYC2_FULL_37_10]
MNTHVEKWLNYAKADLEAAEVLVTHPKSFYSYQLTVLHCHQAIEKILKTFIVSNGGMPKKVHNLIYLLQESGLKLSKEIEEYVATLNPHYQPARYPDITYKGPILRYNEKTAKEHFKNTKEAFECIEKNIIQKK